MNALTNNRLPTSASGGTRVPRVVFGVPPKTSKLAILFAASGFSQCEEVSGATPETTRETRVLPKA